eukprot:g6633.t1
MGYYLSTALWLLNRIDTSRLLNKIADDALIVGPGRGGISSSFTTTSGAGGYKYEDPGAALGFWTRTATAAAAGLDGAGVGPRSGLVDDDDSPLAAVKAALNVANAVATARGRQTADGDDKGMNEDDDLRLANDIESIIADLDKLELSRTRRRKRSTDLQYSKFGPPRSKNDPFRERLVEWSASKKGRGGLRVVKGKWAGPGDRGLADVLGENDFNAADTILECQKEDFESESTDMVSVLDNHDIISLK